MTLFLEFLEKLLKPSQLRGFGRPAKILIWSSDGYTESSVLALSLTMAMRSMILPEAYLELQVTKKRSFFVYETDVRLLKAVEDRLARDRRAKLPSPRRFLFGPTRANSLNSDVISSAMSASYEDPGNAPIVSMRRPRASTSPLLPSLVGDHQVWFDDPRFDGSFPSRVLAFLYLGNLNHAANAYMLHALGISHVVSVGECALIPPPADSSAGIAVSPCATKMPSAVPSSGGSDRRGSLYIEEREGRIKVLDIKGICDDGIDTLEPQLAPICDWIDRAREQGGKVLVHCRVGVSRSATVTIAYVMKYLGISLIEAYLIVRSRRLSVLIQPNMRLLYNLCGWEVKLAHERAAGDAERLRNELARCANWPYLAREVHLLNEKYLHI
jgi:dual specificity MAP kinase phosphatase